MGDMDACVAKFTSDGKNVWTRTIASSGVDISQSLAADG